MFHFTRTRIALAAVILVTSGSLVIIVVKHHHDETALEASIPHFPGLEKTRYVLMHMTPEERQRDFDYGSVYPTIEQAKAALASNPRDPKAHRTLARSYVHAMDSDPNELKNRSLAHAIAEYQAALEADPDNPVTKYNLAAAYAHMGEREKAIALYQQIEWYPSLEETAEGAMRSLQTRIAQGAR